MWRWISTTQVVGVVINVGKRCDLLSTVQHIRVVFNPVGLITGINPRLVGSQAVEFLDPLARMYLAIANLVDAVDVGWAATDARKSALPSPSATWKERGSHSSCIQVKCISVYPLSSRARQGPACKNRRLTRRPPISIVHFQEETKCRQAAARCVSVRPLRLNLRIWGMVARTESRISARPSAPWIWEAEPDISMLVRKRMC